MYVFQLNIFTDLIVLIYSLKSFIDKQMRVYSYLLLGIDNAAASTEYKQHGHFHFQRSRSKRQHRFTMGINVW